MNNIENITCKCGSVFEWTPADKDEVKYINLYRPKHCQDCSDRIELENKYKEAAMAAQKIEGCIARNKNEVAASVSNATPELFRRTDITHPKFNTAAWAKIKNHRMTADLPWIGLVGMTGRCKTRMAYLYAAELIVRTTDTSKQTFKFVASYEISEAVSRLNCDFSEKAEARRFLDQLRNVDVLLIDDLGKGRLAPTVAGELFALIDHRHTQLLPTIWTSNSSPEVIAAGLPEDMAGPFIGRINESSKIFSFGKS
jgi:DNA replication protein DnaC